MRHSAAFRERERTGQVGGADEANQSICRPHGGGTCSRSAARGLRIPGGRSGVVGRSFPRGDQGRCSGDCPIHRSRRHLNLNLDADADANGNAKLDAHPNADRLIVRIVECDRVIFPLTTTEPQPEPAPANLEGPASLNVITPTPKVPSCAQGGRCNVGERGPGGGIVFFANRGEFICGPQRGQVCRYFEAAPIGWNGAREDAFKPWCAKQGRSWPTVYTNEPLGWGRANTQTIVRAYGSDNAAGMAAAYRGGGKSDWYLPAKAEVDELSRQRAIMGAPLLRYCWSSSQAGFSETGAWLPNFASGQWEITYKDFPHSCVRPIRAF